MGESLVQRLTLEGGHVDWWRTGGEAARGLKSAAPDLVICDIRLPDITGDRLFRDLAGTGDIPPFLFVTAFGDINQAVNLIRAGAGDYLTKPFAVADLHASGFPVSIQRRPMKLHDGALGVSEPMRSIARTSANGSAACEPGAHHRRDRRRQGSLRPLSAWPLAARRRSRSWPSTAPPFPPS